MHLAAVSHTREHALARITTNDARVYVLHAEHLTYDTRLVVSTVHGSTVTSFIRG